MSENPLGIRPSLGTDAMAIWTVYANPREVPGYFVVRRFEFDPETHKPFPTDIAFAHRDLEDLRAAMRQMGLFQLPRIEGDEPQVVESWI